MGMELFPKNADLTYKCTMHVSTAYTVYNYQRTVKSIEMQMNVWN